MQALTGNGHLERPLYRGNDGVERSEPYAYADTGLAPARELCRKLKGATSEGRDVAGERKKAKAESERAKKDRLEIIADAYFRHL